MAGRERTLITLLVGHDSEAFAEPMDNGHVFRWTVFVRPLSPHKLTDRSLITKVKFTLHESYEVPVRTVKHPPFECSETGYGSFSPSLEIYFNYPGAKPIKYTYDMLIALDRSSHTEQEVRFELRDCPPNFVELAGKYGPKRKRSSEDSRKDMKESLFPPQKMLKLDEDRSSLESSKDPKKKKEKKEKEGKERERTKEEKEKAREEKDKRKREREKERRKEEKAEKKREKTKSPVETEKKPEKAVVEGAKVSTSSASSQAVPGMPVTPNRPLKTAPNKTAETKAPVETDSSSPSSCGSLTPPNKPIELSTKEMQRKIAALTDEDQIFRVAVVLMSHPSSSLQPSKTALSFDLDLSTADPSLVSRLQEALSS